jgi:sec-independent protein translocase protein TatA
VFDLSPVQIIIALSVALLVFGPRRLPEMGRGLGRGLREFRSTLTGVGPVTTTAGAAGVDDAAAEVRAHSAAPDGR